MKLYTVFFLSILFLLIDEACVGDQPGPERRGHEHRPLQVPPHGPHLHILPGRSSQVLREFHPFTFLIATAAYYKRWAIRICIMGDLLDLGPHG